MDESEVRTLSVDYVGGRPFTDDAKDGFWDELVDLFERYGLKIEGAADGPTEGWLELGKSKE